MRAQPFPLYKECIVPLMPETDLAAEVETQSTDRLCNSESHGEISTL